VAVTIGILAETAPAEARIAATPETIKKYIKAGASVWVESGAGNGTYISDAALGEAGATVVSRDEVLAQANLILSVQIPGNGDLRALKPGTVVVGLANAWSRPELPAVASDLGLTILAVERVPRITRAQSMDVLSSQANIAGYRAVIEAAAHYARAMPMMMTAAGTVAPAKVMVMGAGVAGLQAIATARRLGAVVVATDVRLAAKEQVLSLGAKFVMVEDDESKAAETSGGYAREMSAAYQAKQAALIAETVQKQDIVITTAQIPGRAAPRLVTEAMIKTMRAGSVIVDMAVEQGGNVEGSIAGQVVMRHGVNLVGYINLPSRIASDAASLYARNLWALYGLIVDPETGTWRLDMNDAVIKAMVIAHQGKNFLEEQAA
jgi:NAD(P) transhydrogenase subunit alpha